jgi:FkbM family methyltransferase
MEALARLRVALSLFPHAHVWRWPGLFYYFLGWSCYRALGVRLFRERRLRFKAFTVIGDVEGQSGINFVSEMLVSDGYEWREQDFSGMRLLFDVGANCGAYTLSVCARWPALRACCFEPHPGSFAQLRKNIGANRFDERVTPVAAAAGRVSGAGALGVWADSSMGQLVSGELASPEGPGRVPVEMVSLDDYAARHDAWPDVIKIDVEGFEAEVLQGARACLERARFVCLEVHSEALAGECTRLLREATFDVVAKTLAVTPRQQNALLFARKTGVVAGGGRGPARA